MRIGDFLEENQIKVYKELKNKYRFKKNKAKAKNSEKLTEDDIKELMGSRRYKRINGAIRQV